MILFFRGIKMYLDAINIIKENRLLLMLVIHLKCIALVTHMAGVLCQLHEHLEDTWATSSSYPAHYLARVQTVVLLGYWLFGWTTWHRRM